MRWMATAVSDSFLALLLLVLIHCTFGIVRYSQNAGVEGQLLCFGQPAENVLVKLYQQSSGKLLNSLAAILYVSHLEFVQVHIPVMICILCYLTLTDAYICVGGLHLGTVEDKVTKLNAYMHTFRGAPTRKFKSPSNRLLINSKEFRQSKLPRGLHMKSHFEICIYHEIRKQWNFRTLLVLLSGFH